MTLLYDEKNMKLLEDNIDSIINEARRYALKNVYEPSLKEYNEIIKVILNFIKLNKRIIYGGYGWNELIINKNPKDKLYSEDKIEMPDIDFYSPTPVHDIINICKELHEKGFKSIRAESANNPETYTMFVNQHQYIDVGYMPKILFNKMPLMKVNNLNIAHPKFILIDIMRQYNDPMTSYWRVKKNLLRANLLLKNYPLETRGKFSLIKLDDSTKRILDFIRKNIIIDSNLLVFGYYAYQYYMYKSRDDQKEELYVPYYDVISTNIEHDIKNIYKKILQFDEFIQVEEYHPFYQLLDRKIVFKHNNNIILNVYGNKIKGRGMCIPYWHLEKKKFNVVTFPYMVQSLLINFVYHWINNNKNEAFNMDYLLNDIIKGRNYYLKKHNPHIGDRSENIQGFYL